jgi:hypothetical protein
MHEKSNIDQQEFSVRTELTQLPMRKSCVYGLAARLNVSLPGMERQAAQDLVDAAHQLCPYSNATRGNWAIARAMLGIRPSAEFEQMKVFFVSSGGGAGIDGRDPLVVHCFLFCLLVGF